MSVKNPTTAPRTSSAIEIESMRRELLHVLLIALPLLSWIWLYYALSRGWNPWANALPTVTLCGLGLVCNALQKRSPAVCARALVVAALLALASIVHAHPSSATICLGIGVILLANALLTVWETVLSAVVAWGACVLAASVAIGQNVFLTDGGEFGALYAFTLGITWLGTRPLRASVDLAIEQWQIARDAMLEARQRRAEVYGVMRSLEEAAHRIERMNGELVVARREAEAARNLKARFVATVSHELRGPLNMILGYSRMMALSPDSYGQQLPKVYRADVYAIYRNCQHLLTLIDDILDLSQIQADKMPLVKDQIDVEVDVVDKVLGIVRPLAERKHLNLVAKLHGHLPWVLADPVRLRQALLNILINAIRFTEKGQITVHTELTDSDVVVTVQDSGPGIAHEDIPRLFGEFTQVLRPDTEGEGSGLGLAISKHLIELHRGEIWVESELGQGSTFAFSVPLPGAEKTAPGELIATREATRVSLRQTCLVVHDDPDVVRLLSRHIEGYHVVGATDADVVTDLVQELHPRGIITSPALAQQVAIQIGRTSFDVPLITCDLPSVAGHYGTRRVVSQITKPLVPEVLHAVMHRAEKEGGMTLLIVDDEPDAVRLMERMLMTLPRPYHILRAYNGQQALQIIRGQRPDLVFLDMIMPGMGGQQVLETVAKEPDLEGVSIVIVSGRDWITENTSLGRVFAVTCQHELDAMQGIGCLQAVLNAAEPDYLTGATTPGSFEA